MEFDDELAYDPIIRVALYDINIYLGRYVASGTSLECNGLVCIPISYSCVTNNIHRRDRYSDNV